MPFVQRIVQPKNLGRVQLFDEEGRPRVRDGELEAVTNYTLSNALRQLASVVQIAKEIFDTLNEQLEQVTERTKRLRTRIDTVEEAVNNFDPKAVTVPESDLSDFSARKDHFKSEECQSKDLFRAETRPTSVRRLYQEAGTTPVPLIRHMDRYRKDGIRSSKYFSVTPVLGNNRKRPQPNLDIETRKPAVLGELRRWTSSEALGNVTVDPDCTLRVNPREKEIAEHTLPSPEEQLQAVALKFPAEVVCVDVTGKNFMRMTNFRRSLMNMEYDEAGVRKRGRSRRPRGKRRNTIAGTDAKELEAIVGDSSDTNFGKSTPEDVMANANGAEKKSHLENLKEWGKSRLRQMRNGESSVKLRTSGSRRKWEKDEVNPHSSSGNWSASSESGHSTATSHIPSEPYADCRSSVSSGSMCLKHKRPTMVSTSSSVTSESTLTPDDGETGSMYSCDTEGYYTSFHLDSGLKTLREEEPCPAMHCTSALSVGSHANISTLTADSEYELFGKGSTSTTASSNGTVCTTLLVPPAPSVPERVCSQLSGNNTLPERNTKSSVSEIVKRETQSLKLDKKSNMKMLTFSDIKKTDDSKSDDRQPDRKENPNSEVGRKNENCMITVDVHHRNHDRSPEKCGDSPDSGHNTCSSPVDSVASPSIDLEMSECSDLEGVDRVERIRVKTTINSSRIPSMCVITPPQSDDEISLNQYNKSIDSGEYVTIADFKKTPAIPPAITRDSEYISLNELPLNDSLERRRKGARVTLDAEGKVVYSSDSLRRKKTTGTFEPGPCVASTNSPIPPRQINIRPVQIQSSLAVNRLKTAKSPTAESAVKQQNAKENSGCKELLVRRPLSPVSPNRTVSPFPNRVQNISNSKQYFPKSSYDRVSPSRSSRPLSPLVSPSSNGKPVAPPVVSPQKAASPKMVVKAKPVAQQLGGNGLSAKGAYVKVAQPSDDPKLLVKRSDSYRLANNDRVINSNALPRKQYQYPTSGPSPTPNALQAANNNKAPQVSPKPDATAPSSSSSSSSPQGLRSGNIGQSTWPRSTSTPTKNNEVSPMDFSTLPSPIQNNHQQAKSTRSAMDLFAIIHESKKRIQSLQKPPAPGLSGKANEILGITPNYPKSQIGSIKNCIPQPMAPLNNINGRYCGDLSKNGFHSLPRIKVRTLEESPKNLLQRKLYARSNAVGDVDHRAKSTPAQERRSLASDRHGPPQPTSRNDFKRLLLQTGSGATGPAGRGSAVERLKNRTRYSDGGPTGQTTWKFDVLSTTIPEDCSDEDERDSARGSDPLKSSALVSAQNRVFQARGSPTLETAL